MDLGPCGVFGECVSLGSEPLEKKPGTKSRAARSFLALFNPVSGKEIPVSTAAGEHAVGPGSCFVPADVADRSVDQDVAAVGQRAISFRGSSAQRLADATALGNRRKRHQGHHLVPKRSDQSRRQQRLARTSHDLHGQRLQNSLLVLELNDPKS